MSGAEAIKLTAVGDLMLGDSAKCIGFGSRSLARNKGDDALFAAVSGLLQGDIVFGNLECVLSDRIYNRYSFTRGQMSASPSVASAIARAGFNVVSVANNHTMQFGEEAFRETCSLLREHGIGVVGVRGEGGWACQPYLLEAGGRVTGFLAYSLERDNYCESPLYATGSDAEIVADIRRLRPDCDHLVVSMHWGSEFVPRRSQRQAELAGRIVESGGDVVLGHHPHVVQEVELYRERPVFYSLGNFISDMLWDDPLKESLVARVELLPDRTAVAEILKVKMTDGPMKRSVSAVSLTQYLSDQGDFNDLEKEYQCAVERERVRQRNLSHLFLFKNVYKYNILIFIQIIARSVKSVLFG